MNNQYTISSSDGKLLIKTTLNPNEINKRLNQIAKQFHQSKLIVTDSENKNRLRIFNYNKASDLREQLETLVVQNFKDAWEEGFQELINACKGTGELDTTEEEYRKLDWAEAKDEFLFHYLQDIEELIKKESGLFDEVK